MISANGSAEGPKVNDKRINDIAVEFKNSLIINPELDESAKYV